MKIILLTILLLIGLQTQAQVCATGWHCSTNGDTTFLQTQSSVGANSQTWSMAGHYVSNHLDWGDGTDTTFIGVQQVSHIYTPGFVGHAILTTTFFDSLTNSGVCTATAGWQNYVCTPNTQNVSPCDSMTLSFTPGSPQTILMAEVPNINTIIDYWITTAPDGTVLGEDSMWNSHQIYNGQPYDTINVCITYADAAGYSTCCVTWIWDANTVNWARMGIMTSIGEIVSSDKKLLKVTDLLGREVEEIKNTNLFYIYDNGTVEKKIIID